MGCWGRLVAGVLLAAAAPGGAVTVAVPVPVVDRSVGDALRSLAERAADVFVGQVVKIVRKGGVVEVSFRVDESVAGAQAGMYVMREWGGLWPVGQARYYVGQRAMVFVGAKGASGLSSPVDGADGLVPVLMMGVGVDPVLDVERLAARVERSQGAALKDAEHGAMLLSEATAAVAGLRTVGWREPRLVPLPVRYRRRLPPLTGPVLRMGVPFASGGGAMWTPEVVVGR